MRVIIDCYVGPENFGIYSISLPLKRYVVYAQDIKEVCGFLTKQSAMVVNNTTFIEVGTFFEYLFDSDLTAWKILYCPSRYCDIYDAEELKETVNKYVNKSLIYSLYSESKNNLKKISERLANYCEDAYFCAEKLMLSESLLLSEKFDIKQIELLQSIQDCKIHDDTFKTEMRKIVKNIKKHLDLSSLPELIDRKVLNEQLLKLRNLW